MQSDSTFRIPLIDFSKYREANSMSEKRRTAGMSLFVFCVLLSTCHITPDEIVNGFKEVGFVYLSGHGISSDTVQTAFEKVR